MKAAIESGKYWDRAWSLVDGCTKVSPGCEHCWLDRMHRLRGVEPGTVKFQNDRLKAPLKRKKPTIYSIWSDLLHEEVPINCLEDALAVITQCPQHQFLLLTKREDRLKLLTKDRLRISRTDTWPINNLWLGVTAENQEQADKRIPELLRTPAAHRFVSIEPMLGEVDLNSVMGMLYPFPTGWQKLDWVVAGAETGPKRRPCKIEWIRSIRDQCQAAGVPLWIKGISGAICEQKCGYGIYSDHCWNCKLKNKVSHDMAEWPEELRIRQRPEMKP